MFLSKSPRLVKKYYSRLVWDIPNEENKVFLTFDDGPTVGVTNWVLDLLNRYEAKATFFCIGENVVRNPEIYQKILEEGHVVGNHTYNHLKGWETPNGDYFENIRKCEKHIISELFRPPYGRIRKSQIAEVVKDYRIIMWDVLSGDFDNKISPEKCLNNVIRYTSSGSIIVFHDSQKAFPNLEYTLPRVLEHFKKEGFNLSIL